MNCTLPEVSAVFTARSAGYLASAPITAVIVSDSNRSLVLLVHMIVMAVTVALIPLSSWISYSQTVFYSAAAVNGISSGGLESIVHIWLLQVWGKGSTPFMQSLQFAFAFGCAAAPIIAAPFLTDPHLILYPYTITAVTVLIAALMLTVTFFETRKEPVAEEMTLQSKTHDSDDQGAGETNGQTGIRQQVILLASLFLICYSGTSIIYNQFLPTYLQTAQSLTPEKSSYIHSTLNYVSMMSRAVSIFASIRLPPQFLLFFNLIMFDSGSLFSLLFSGKSESLIWAGNVMIGLGMGGCTGPLYSFLYRHVQIGNLTGSLFVFCNGFTSVIVPLLIASLMSAYPDFLMWLNVVTMTTALAIFVAIYWLSAQHRRRSQIACVK